MQNLWNVLFKVIIFSSFGHLSFWWSFRVLFHSRYGFSLFCKNKKKIKFRWKVKTWGNLGHGLFIVIYYTHACHTFGRRPWGAGLPLRITVPSEFQNVWWRQAMCPVLYTVGLDFYSNFEEKTHNFLTFMLSNFLFSADTTIFKKNLIFFAHKMLKKPLKSKKNKNLFFYLTALSCPDGPNTRIKVPKCSL